MVPLFLSGLMILVLFFLSLRPLTLPSDGTVTQNDPLMIKTDEGNFVAYAKDNYDVGSVISFKATINEPIPSYLIGQFDYANYLKSQNIQASLWLEDVNVIGHETGFYSFRESLNEYMVQTFDRFNPYIKAFVLAEKDGFDEDFFDRVRYLGISHVFALSGLHVSFVSNALDKGLKRFNKPKTTFTFISLFLLFYLALSNFSVSFLRAFFLYGFLSLNRLFKKEYTALDGLSFIFILSLIMNPYVIYDSGFLLSYSITGGLLLMTPLLKSKKAMFHVSWIAFLVTFPLVLRLNGFVNLTGLIINIPIVLFLGILLPMSYLVFLLPFLESFFEPLIIMFELIINILYEKFFIPFSWPLNNDLVMIFYYLFLGIFFVGLLKKDYKKMGLFLGFILFIKLKPLWMIIPKMTMLNVDGDAFLIEDKLNQCNILIDGGSENSADSLIKHLKLSGVKTIHVMVATHNHDDHTKGLEAVLNDPYFNVLEVITSENLSEEFKEKTCGQLSLLYYPKEEKPSTTNNSSIVLGVFLGEYKMLFTGDIEVVREETFTHYPVIDYDLLKVPHHGSITSSSEYFLDHITPEIALINLPYYNTHQFPHEKVMKRFEERFITVYQSDMTGNVTVYFINDKPYIIEGQ